MSLITRIIHHKYIIVIIISQSVALRSTREMQLRQSGTSVKTYLKTYLEHVVLGMSYTSGKR
jgi:hypothetical protein